MTVYAAIGIGAAVVAALMVGQKIGQLKERAKNAEDKAKRNKRNAEIAARPPADRDTLLDLMRDDKM